MWERERERERVFTDGGVYIHVKANENPIIKEFYIDLAFSDIYVIWRSDLKIK